jgi:hypothetical protein
MHNEGITDDVYEYAVKGGWRYGMESERRRLRSALAIWSRAVASDRLCRLWRN